MYFSGALIGGLWALSHLAHGYCPTGGGQAVSVVDTGTGGLCSMITGAVDTVVAKVEDSLSGFDNTTSGILGYSVIGHEWVSDITTLFYGGTTKDGVSSIYDTSGDIFFVANIPVSVNGRIVFGFTDLVLYTVDNDLVNDSMPATTTDLIVAPKYDLILWEDAQMCTFSDRWFITKDIIALPVYEVAVWPWDLSNVVSLWQDPRLDYRTVLLDSDPVPAETASASLGKNAAGRLSGVTRLVRQGSKGTLGTWSVRLAVRALTLAFGLGLYLLVVGAMLCSTLAASWYYTGIGDGVSLAALEAAILGWNYFSPVRPAFHLERNAPIDSIEASSTVEDLSDPWEGILELYLEREEEATLEAVPAPGAEEDLSKLSDEELERQILELRRRVEAHDANIDRLESGVAFWDAQDAALGRMEEGLAAAEGVADDILDILGDRGWEDVGGEGEEEVGVVET